MEIMELGSSIEGYEMQYIKVWHIITTVNIYCLKQPDSHPGPQNDEVVGQQEDSNEETCTQNQSLQRMSILSSHAKWGLEVMMYFVYVLVDALVMQSLVGKVMPCVLYNSTAKAAQSKLIPYWYLFITVWDVKELREGVSTQDQRELYTEVIEHQ